MNKKKVLHITQSGGGVKVYVNYIINKCNKYDHILIAPYDVDGVLKSYLINMKRLSSLKKEIKDFIKIFQLVKKVDPDLIHAHSSKGGLYGRLIGLILRKKVIFTPNAFSYLRYSGFKRKIFIVLEIILSKFPHYFMPSSPSEEKRAIVDLGYKKSKILSGYYNCIEILNSNNIMRSKKNNNLIKLLFVGRLTYQKNPLFLIEVFKRLLNNNINYRLTIIGSGYDSELQDAVYQKIEEYKIQKFINIIPWMEREELFNEYLKHDIFVLTSRYESFGYVTCEAMSQNLPVISTKIDGSTDLIIDNYNGFLVTSTSEMIEKIELLAHDSHLRKKFSKNAFNFVNKNYNIDSNIKNLEENYSFVINH